MIAAIPAVQTSSGPTLTTASRCNRPAIAEIFADDAQTRIIAVHAFAKGDAMPVVDGPSKVAGADLCMVKLLVGPGTSGPASAPSTQAGIGIEIWLPTAAAWNGRIHNVGGAGFMGLPEVKNPNAITPGVSSIYAPSTVAAEEGAVSAITDTGHSTPGTDMNAYNDGSFLLRPDGSVSTEQWAAFSEKGIHQTTLKTKLLTQGFYGRAASHAYFEGCSTGGRQAHKYAQAFPTDYDGIIAGAPGINWSRFLTSGLYLQVRMQRALGSAISPAKLTRVSAAAVSACDARVSGMHDGYISDPMTCAYDPTKDKALLCQADGGRATGADCISIAEARTVNALWYGQTADGSSADPATLAGLGDRLAPGQLWFGLTRGSNLGMSAGSESGRGKPFDPSAFMVAYELGRGAIGTPLLRNAASNGTDGWRNLSYADMASASHRGPAMQTVFSGIDTDSPDLTRFKSRGGKMLVYHGLADELVPPQGSFHYYRALEARMGGERAVDPFYRLFTIPGMGHCAGVGTVNGVAGVSPKASPPMPESGQFYRALVAWVEHDKAPEQIIVNNAAKTASRPLCRYPLKLKYTSGDVSKASSYQCAS